MSLKKIRKISATECIRLVILVEHGKWSDTLHFQYSLITRHNSADSVPTSNLVCIKEVAIRTTFCIAGIIYYTYNLVNDTQCTRYKNAFNTRF